MPRRVVTMVRDRVGGAEAGLAELRLEVRPEWIRYSQSNADLARQAAVEILGAQPRPTAILATNEEMALANVSAAGELGLTIGVDLSIVGFDDAPGARVFNPPISVIRRPVAELGATAVEFLLEKITDNTLRRSRNFLQSSWFAAPSVRRFPEQFPALGLDCVAAAWFSHCPEMLEHPCCVRLETGELPKGAGRLEHRHAAAVRRVGYLPGATGIDNDRNGNVITFWRSNVIT